MSAETQPPARPERLPAARSPYHVLLAGALAAISIVAVAAGSAASVPFNVGGDARLRLSWSARPERIEECRTLSEEELALRAEHMRQRVECEGKFATYELEVAVDGRRLEREVIMGGGLRNDRPIHHLRELSVPAGEHRMRVALRRREAASPSAEPREHDEDDADDDAESGISTVRTERERTERARRARTALPAEVVLDTTLSVGAGQVVVVTFDPGQRRFMIVQP